MRVKDYIAPPPKPAKPSNLFPRLWRKFTTGSTNRQVFGATATIAVLTSVAKLASVAKELLVARRFGTGGTIEAYLVALLIPLLAINVIASSFSIALIPSYIHVRDRDGKEAAQRLLSGVTVWSLILLGLTTLVVLITGRLYLPFLASGFNETKLKLAFQLLCVVSPIIVLSGIANIWGAVLNSAERFALVALAPIITPSVTVAVLLIIRYSIFALPIGMVLGAAFETAMLGIALKIRGISLRPRWHGFDFHLERVFGQFGPRVGANLLRSGSTVVDRSFAATLSPGSVAALSYGNRIIGTLLTIAATAIGTAITPYYSKMISHKDWTGARRTLKQYLVILFLLSIPVVIVLYFSAIPVTRLVFQRGSFRARDTILVAHVHAFYVFQIPFSIGNVLVTRLLTSLLASRIILWAAAMSLVLNIVLDLLFMRLLGVAGIALASSCASLVVLCFLFYYTQRLLRQRTDMTG